MADTLTKSSKRRPKELDDDTLLELYKDHTAREIAAMYSANRNTVKGWIRTAREHSRAGITAVTLTISEKDKKKLKAYAAAHETTMSDLLHEWIEEHCV
ncbi:MAG: hypothetical protein LIP12_12830 [Clostridiales bacterium]|nr:hypothetical protein [Clostridiales bacterium]